MKNSTIIQKPCKGIGMSECLYLSYPSMKTPVPPALPCLAEALREGKKGAIRSSIFFKGLPLPSSLRVGVYLLFICAFLSCKKENRWDCLKRTGEQTTEIRTLPPF